MPHRKRHIFDNPDEFKQGLERASSGLFWEYGQCWRDNGPDHFDPGVNMVTDNEIAVLIMDELGNPWPYRKWELREAIKSVHQIVRDASRKSLTR